MTTKTTLYIATSIDGFIARKNGSVDWLDKFNSPKEDYGYNKFLKSIDTIIMGSTSYEQILTFGEFPYKNKTCYVFTSRNLTEDNNVQFIKQSPKQFIKKHQKQAKNIWLLGGSNLANQFLKNNLIDKLIIFIMPTILGEGIRLFQNNNKELQLTLKKSKSYKSGAIELRYER